MPDEKNPTPDILEEFRRWIYAHFGFLGLAALAAVGLIFYVWTHWEDVKKWPGVARLIEHRWRLMWTLRLDRQDTWPIRKMAPLTTAAQHAYGRMHGTVIAEAAEREISGDPANPPHWVAIHMITTLHLALYGRKPYSQKSELIDQTTLRQFRISDDLRRLEDPQWNDADSRVVYEDLQMKWSDVRRYVFEQRHRK